MLKIMFVFSFARSLQFASFYMECERDSLARYIQEVKQYWKTGMTRG